MGLVDLRHLCDTKTDKLMATRREFSDGMKLQSLLTLQAILSQ